jgi:hypothetical protein
MDLILTRTSYEQDGIFSELTQEDGTLIAYTLEHSYDNEPKIPNGSFVCVRGQHRLNGMTEDFTTFEITGVEGHSNLLFHWGNYNKDSEGCVLLGEKIVHDSNESNSMITNSRATFAKFMELQEGIDSFLLTVKG